MYTRFGSVGGGNQGTEGQNPILVFQICVLFIDEVADVAATSEEYELIIRCVELFFAPDVMNNI